MANIEAPASFAHAPEVSLRAHRTYVHSTTLYEEMLAGAISAGLQPDGPVELRVRRLMRHQPELHYSQSANDLATDCPAAFLLHAKGVLWHGMVMERSDPVLRQTPYDERPIWELAVQDGRAVRVDGETGMRPIETVTALGLWLHRRLFSIPEGRKWFLTRLEFVQPFAPEDVRRLRIEVKRSVGTTMTRSFITHDDVRIGCLEYMLGDET